MPHRFPVTSVSRLGNGGDASASVGNGVRNLPSGIAATIVNNEEMLHNLPNRLGYSLYDAVESFRGVVSRYKNRQTFKIWRSQSEFSFSGLSTLRDQHFVVNTNVVQFVVMGDSFVQQVG